jgi:hypothetical protein
MAAAQTDMFKKTGAGTVTTLAAPGKALSATSITVGATTNHPTDTGIVIAIRQVDSAGELVAGTYTEWSATVTSGTSFAINAVPVYGSDQVYAAGSTTQVYIPLSAYAHNELIDGILTEHNQDGTHSNITATTVTADEFIVNGATSEGWQTGVPTPDTVTYNGNRSYDLTFNSNDLTDTVSNGMRLKLARTVTPPTQCTDLESGSSQYWSKTSPSGISFTTTFTCAAWIKLESYVSSGIIARRNADTEGWSFGVEVDGTLVLLGLRIASNNKKIQSYQSLPLNKWVHVAACIDMTAGDTSAQKIWIDGVEVPRAYTLTGTATALVQGTTALVVGALKSAGTSPLDGKIAQASVHSACLSDAQIKAMASQTISSSTPSIVSGFTFNGAATDVTANANDLTASGGATYGTDSPFNATEYGIITANTFSTNTTLTVQVPEGYAIPTSGGVSSMYYSTQDTPYGFPKERSKWTIEVPIRGTTTGISISAIDTWSGSSNFALVVPIGNWKIVHQGTYIQRSNVSRTIEAVFTLRNTTYLPTTNNSYSHELGFMIYTHASVSASLGSGYNSVNISLPAQATFNPAAQIPTASGIETWEVVGARGPVKYTAEFNYV